MCTCSRPQQHIGTRLSTRHLQCPFDMWSSSSEVGVGDLPKVVLQCRSAATGAVEHSADVYLFGATVTSYVHNGNENIFVSPLAIFNGAKAIRGGIPIVFPQFGQPNPSMLQHGFARNKTWAISSVSSDDHSAEAEFYLQHDDQTLAVWPHRFSLRYTARLTDCSLRCELRISCPDETPFSCQALLHTYLRIGDISSLGITGFKDLPYTDKTRGGDSFVEDVTERTVDGEVDRVYVEDEAGRISDIELAYGHGKRLRVAKGAVLSTPTGSSRLPTDVVLWNPWEEKAAALPDMSDDGYRQFVCVEPGVVHGWTDVSKDSSVLLFQEIFPTCDSNRL